MMTNVPKLWGQHLSANRKMWRSADLGISSKNKRGVPIEIAKCRENTGLWWFLEMVPFDFLLGVGEVSSPLCSAVAPTVAGTPDLKTGGSAATPTLGTLLTLGTLGTRWLGARPGSRIQRHVVKKPDRPGGKTNQRPGQHDAGESLLWWLGQGKPFEISFFPIVELFRAKGLTLPPGHTLTRLTLLLCFQR